MSKNDKLWEELAKLNEIIGNAFSVPKQYHKFVIDGLHFTLTCQACPEQYDVIDEAGRKAGYLRLRHGTFRVDYPDCGDETIYVAQPQGDGIFDNNERDFYIAEAIRVIKARRHGEE